MLESLERSNLFVVPLDDSRHWYRYHHLFADVLRAHLHRGATRRGRRPAPSGRASGTPRPASPCRRSGTRSPPGTSSSAADLVERSVIGLLRERQEATVRGWLDDIPDDVVRRRPVLAVGFIGALMSRR